MSASNVVRKSETDGVPETRLVEVRGVGLRRIREDEPFFLADRAGPVVDEESLRVDVSAEIPGHERKVFLVDGRIAVVHGGRRPARARGNDQSGGLAVEPVHETDLAVFTADKVPERVAEERPGRVHAQVSGLVDDQ